MANCAIVEDDASIRQLLGMLLKAENWEVVDFEQAEDALGYLFSAPVSAIIMDVWLPDMSGIEASRRLRQRSIETPILLMTAGNVEQLAEQVSSLRNVVLKDKWLSPEELRTLLRSVRSNGSFE